MYRPHNCGLELAPTKVVNKILYAYGHRCKGAHYKYMIATRYFVVVVTEPTQYYCVPKRRLAFYYQYIFCRTDMCVKETVTFTNNGSCPVRVSWMPSADNAGAAVGVAPESFEVVDRAKISVRVEPLRPGSRLRETLRFSAQNRDGSTGETVLYVRGAVERVSRVSVRPAMAPLGNVCAGMLESYHVELEVTSDGPFHVQRRLYAFDTAAAGARLSPRGDAKSFGPYGDGSTTQMQRTAVLNFKTPVDTEVGGKCSVGKRVRVKTGRKLCYVTAEF